MLSRCSYGNVIENPQNVIEMFIKQSPIVNENLVSFQESSKSYPKTLENCISYRYWDDSLKKPSVDKTQVWVLNCLPGFDDRLSGPPTQNILLSSLVCWKLRRPGLKCFPRFINHSSFEPSDFSRSQLNMNSELELGVVTPPRRMGITCELACGKNLGSVHTLGSLWCV